MTESSEASFLLEDGDGERETVRKPVPYAVSKTSGFSKITIAALCIATIGFAAAVGVVTVEKNEQIQSQNTTISTQENNITAYENDISDKNTQIETLTTQVDSQTEQIDSLSQELAADELDEEYLESFSASK